jgi:Leucine-rich repeat (LRR) protein
MSNILLTGFSNTIIDCEENISEQSPVVLLSLNSNISSGSIDILYTLSTSKVLTQSVTVTFTNKLGLVKGGTLDITTGVTINAGQLSGYTNVILPYEYYDLNLVSEFTNIVSPTLSTINLNKYQSTQFLSPTYDCTGCQSGYTWISTTSGYCFAIVTAPQINPPFNVPYAAHSAPSGSTFGTNFYQPGYPLSGNGTFTNIRNNQVWGNPTFNSLIGPYNRSNIQISGITQNVWYGSRFCVTGVTGGTYYMGLGSQSNIKVKINNVNIIDTSLSPINVLNWYVYPINLNAGVNIFEVSCMTTNPNASFVVYGLEVYNNTLSQLTAATVVNPGGAPPYMPTQLNIVFNAYQYLLTHPLFKATVVQNLQGQYSSELPTCPSGYTYSICNFACEKTITCTQPIDPLCFSFQLSPGLLTETKTFKPCCISCGVIKVYNIPANIASGITTGNTYYINNTDYDGCVTCVSNSFSGNTSYNYQSTTISSPYVTCTACTSPTVHSCPCKLRLTFNSSGTTSPVNFSISGASNLVTTVIWGDNTTNTYSGAIQNITHTYTTSGIKNAVVSMNDCRLVTNLDFNVSNGTTIQSLTNITGLENLTELITLDLSANQLTSFDPACYLSHVLYDLNLSYNSITTFNPTYQLPSTIYNLNLSHNQIGPVFNPTLPLPANLHTFNLSYNLIGPLFSPTLQLPNQLYELNLSHNLIGPTFDPVPVLPDSIYILNLGFNLLAPVFNPRHYPTNLGYLYLNNNNIGAAYDPQPGLPSNLIWLDLSHNIIGPTFDPILHPLPTTLQYLNLAYNNLTGFSPTLLSGCTVLDTLILSHNQIDPFDPYPCLPQSVRILYLDYNNLHSFNPCRCALPTNLKYLYLQVNHIGNNGTTTFDPSCFPLPAGLIYLNLSTNELAVFDPTHFALPVSLKTLYLSNNFLGRNGGQFNPQNFQLPNLTSLYLNGNQLLTYNPIQTNPSFTSQFPPTLNTLDVSSNLLPVFSPTLWSTKYQQLVNLYLGKNQLPSFNLQLPITMKILDINTNLLTTFTPTGGIGTLPVFQSLLLSSNLLPSFSMSLPASLLKLDLSKNKITVFSSPLPVPTLLTSLLLNNNLMNTTSVNNVLVYLQGVAWTLGVARTFNSQLQTPTAPPSGAGVTAKTYLQGRGWTVLTD